VTLSGAFFLVVGIPLLVLMFGNIYCGYICPFGAAQELLSYVVPSRFKRPSPREKMRKARFVKYVVLFVFVMVFFLSRNRTTLAADPLISFFNLRFSIYDFQSVILWIIGIGLLGSLFYTRFWCRYLCPAGAFLSLFNNVIVLKRFLPVKKFGKCGFGLTAKDNMDCIYCDKCRYETMSVPEPLALVPAEHAGEPLLSRYLVVAAVLAALFVSAVSADRFFEVTPAGIRQGRLSNREAEYYKKTE